MTADLDPAEPRAREAQMFPRLTEDMSARIAGYGAIEALPAGTAVFERGQRGVDWFFVLDGGIAISGPDGHGGETLITTHRARQFTGEMDLFNDRAILVSGRTIGETRVIRVRRPAFRQLVSTRTGYR